MAGEVRFCEQAQTGNPASARKLMPVGLSDNLELQILDDALEQKLQSGQTAESLRRAAMSFDDPLNSVHPYYALGLRLTAVGTKLADLGNRLPAI